jgi:hypothetical protein
MIREKFKGNKPKNESTDAKNCGGTVCSSDEVSVNIPLLSKPEIL